MSVNRASTICGFVSTVINSALVAGMHNRCMGSFNWQQREHHGHRPILRLIVNGASTIFGFVSTVIN